MSFVDDKVLIVWEWQFLHPQDDCDSISQASNSLQNSDHSDAESDANIRPTHTIPFKVFRCTKETDYQQTLRMASSQLDRRATVAVQLKVEPDNPVDPNAVAFVCNMDGTFKRIGYVVKEAQSAVRDALHRNDVIAVRFKWVKYVSDWYRMEPGYFAAVNITKRGMWPLHVVQVKSTR